METTLEARADEIAWHHSIDLGEGVVTRGLPNRGFSLDDSLPDFTGRSVLDIGAWDGYSSFLAERRGARRAVALDHCVWGVDMAGAPGLLGSLRRGGGVPGPRS